MDSNENDIASFSAYCGYCGAKIAWKGTGKRIGKRTWKRRIVVHINICQEPPIIYFCNQRCKLNWIFKSPDLELDKKNKNNSLKMEDNSSFYNGLIEDNTKELKNYLKDNKIKIIRQA
ncbi:MAG: hypothetical protein ACFFAO_01310 [Candidatus Hermodarchaeota archaeon]